MYMVGLLVEFNVALELLLTVWDSSLRMIWKHAITIFIRHGRENTPALVSPEVEFERELTGNCTHYIFCMH